MAQRNRRRRQWKRTGREKKAHRNYYRGEPIHPPMRELPSPDVKPHLNGWGIPLASLFLSYRRSQRRVVGPAREGIFGDLPARLPVEVGS